MSKENLKLWIVDSGLSNIPTQFPGRTFRNYDWNWDQFHTDLIKSLANNTAPDLIEIGSTWTSRLAQEGVLLNITQFATRTLNVAGAFLPRTLHSCRHPFQIDQYFALPLLADVRVLFYNVELFESYLTQHPNAFDNWHTFEQMCLTLRSKLFRSVIAWPLGEAGFHDLLPWIWTSGGDFISSAREVFIDSERTVEAIYRLTHLILTDCAPTPPDPQSFGDPGRVRNQFTAGRIGMMAGAYWMKDEYAWHKRFKAVRHPPDLFPAAFIGGSNIAIVRKYGNDENAEAYEPAKKLLQEMVGVDNQLLLADVAGKLPCNIFAWKKMQKDASDETKELLAIFSDALSYTINRSLPNLPNSVQIEEVLKSCVKTIWNRVGEIRMAAPEASVEELGLKCKAMIKEELEKAREVVETFIIGYTIQYTPEEIKAMSLKPPSHFDLWLEITSNRPLRGKVYIAEGEEIGLAPIPFQILFTIVNAPQRMVKQEKLLKEVWGYQSRSDHRHINVLMPWIKELFALLGLFETSFDITPKELLRRLEQHRQSLPNSVLIKRLEERNQWPEFTGDQFRRLVGEVIAEGREIAEHEVDQTAIDTLNRTFSGLRAKLGGVKGKQIIDRIHQDDDDFYYVDKDLSICLVTS